MLSTSLVIVGKEMDTRPLMEKLRTTDGERVDLGAGVVIHTGPDRASLTFDERHTRSVDEQVTGLCDFLDSHRPVLEEMKKSGLSVSADVSGVADSASEIHVSPNVLTRLADLQVPLRFTTFRELEEEDPLAWLDD